MCGFLLSVLALDMCLSHTREVFKGICVCVCEQHETPHKQNHCIDGDHGKQQKQPKIRHFLKVLKNYLFFNQWV